MPSVRDFCDKHNILWFPIVLEIKQNKDDPNKKEKVLKPINNECYAHAKKTKEGKSYKSYKPEPTDFDNLSIETIKQRQDFITMSDWIAIDTRFIHQIDIDYDEIDVGYHKLKEVVPYFKSATKGFPHMFIKQEGFTPQSARIQLKNAGIKPDPKKNEEGVELLCGQWSYARWNDEVVNGDKPPYELTNIETMFLTETDKKPKKVKKMLPLESSEKVENVIINSVVLSENDKHFEMVNQFIEQGLLTSRCDTHESWVLIGIHFKTAFGDEKGLILWGRLTELYGSNNKKAEYQGHYQYLKPHDDVSKALNVIKKYAKDCDALQYKNIVKSIETDTLAANGIQIVDNDKEGADIIYERIKSIVKYCNNTLYLKEKNVWRNDINYIQDWLLRFILNSEIYKMGLNGPMSFVQDLRAAKAVREIVLSNVRLNIDIDFANKLHTTTRGRLCFIDGVLDFQTQKFYAWDKIDFEYYSCIQIPMHFGEYVLFPDFDLINKIKTDILEPVFCKDIDRALHFFSRALGGYTQDKNYGTFNGNRDCGKGILYALFEAFGDYLKSFELSNVLVGRNDNKTQESSRMTYWLLDYEFTRLAFTQETPDPEENLKINGRLFKKINSGGDTQTARRNYDREDTRFIIDFTMFIAGNNPLKYTEKDCKQHEIGFTGIKSFKTEEEIDDMRKQGASELALKEFGVKDTGLKDRVKTDEYKMAFIYLIFSSFKSYPVSVKYIVDDNEDEISMPLSHKILKRYIITNDIKNDKIGTNEIMFEGTDSKKIALAIESMGIVKKKWTGRDEYRNKWVYVGIRPKTEEEMAEGDIDIDDEEED